MDLRLKRSAHVSDLPDPSERPVILDKNTHIPILLRQHAADKLFEILSTRKPKAEAIKEALALEAQLYLGCRKKNVYKNNLLGRLASLKRPEPVSIPSISYADVEGRLEDLLVSDELMRSIGFPSAKHSERIVRSKDEEVACSRCRQPFTPDHYYTLEEADPCPHHHGKLLHVRNQRNKVYSCCGAEADGITCTTAPRHVYRSNQLYTDEDIVMIKDIMVTQECLVALDGEMCHTEKGLELCRLTVVSWEEKPLLDVLIKPSSPIIDYNTRFSGLTEEIFSNPSAFPSILPPGLEARLYTLQELQQSLLPAIIGPQTILVGHSIENDLFYMRLEHGRIIDTSVLYPHNKGWPYRVALRDLTRIHLKQFVQEASSGHDSFEDCVACLRLLKLQL